MFNTMFEVYSMQHYDLRQVDGFHRVLQFAPPRYNWNIVESGIKHHNSNPRGHMNLCHHVVSVLYLTQWPYALLPSCSVYSLPQLPKGHMNLAIVWCLFFNLHIQRPYEPLPSYPVCLFFISHVQGHMNLCRYMSLLYLTCSRSYELLPSCGVYYLPHLPKGHINLWHVVSVLNLTCAKVI